MPSFVRGVPRLLILLVLLAGLCAVPPELLSKGPDLCLWRHLFHLAGCPACGTTRALAALFHGRVQQALAYNRNVAASAPGFVILLGQDLLALARRVRHSAAATAIENRFS